MEKIILNNKDGKVKGLSSGLIVSDPEYGKDIPYRFETIYDLNGFYAAVKITHCEEIAEYNGKKFPVSSLKAKVGLFRRKKDLRIFSSGNYNPEELEGAAYAIGVDSAHLYFGGREPEDLAAEGICLGGDGQVGYVIEFRDIRDKSTEGIIVELEFSDDIISDVELTQEILARFHIETK